MLELTAPVLAAALWEARILSSLCQADTGLAVFLALFPP